ncbi:hypothetical protein ALC62_04983 [Cyphomyrmex costatus]|uniref:Uncharacterized protein n=1 Tax=Cyphomyrmex costatus TaxID=456900 RepID=A0A195CUL5_9HYME|nr:hypothetical protein ALC62_04983 [Cyphomyrmex costatus]
MSSSCSFFGKKYKVIGFSKVESCGCAQQELLASGLYSSELVIKVYQHEGEIRLQFESRSTLTFEKMGRELLSSCLFSSVIFVMKME